jgi:hypothetical protein
VSSLIVSQRLWLLFICELQTPCPSSTNAIMIMLSFVSCLIQCALVPSEVFRSLRLVLFSFRLIPGLARRGVGWFSPQPALCLAYRLRWLPKRSCELLLPPLLPFIAAASRAAPCPEKLPEPPPPPDPRLVVPEPPLAACRLLLLLP